MLVAETTSALPGEARVEESRVPAASLSAEESLSLPEPSASLRPAERPPRDGRAEAQPRGLEAASAAWRGWRSIRRQAWRYATGQSLFGSHLHRDDWNATPWRNFPAHRRRP